LVCAIELIINSIGSAVIEISTRLNFWSRVNVVRDTTVSLDLLKMSTTLTMK